MLLGNKVVIVGGTSGMGLAGAQALAERGAHVVVVGRSEEKLRIALEQIIPKAEGHAVDFAVEQDVRSFFEKLGRFDHLVVTAGAGFRPAPFVEADTGLARKVLEGKFWVQYIAAKYGAQFINPGGSITLFSGVASRKPMKGAAALCANNGAIEALGRALAVELAPIRVNVISPGLVDTPLWHDMSEHDRISMFGHSAKVAPVGRVGTPGDIAQTIVYVVENGYTTGTVIDVDGGVQLV